MTREQMKEATYKLMENLVKPKELIVKTMQYDDKKLFQAWSEYAVEWRCFMLGINL